MNHSYYPTVSAQWTTIHMKTETIKLQKRLNEKINTRDNPTENETTNPTKKKRKHKLQKVDIDQLQDKRKRSKTNSKPPYRN